MKFTTVVHLGVIVEYEGKHLALVPYLSLRFKLLLQYLVSRVGCNVLELV